MENEYQNALTIIAVLVLGAIGLVALIIRQKQLDDPNDDSVVYLSQLQDVVKLGTPGIYRVITYRQSGNIHKEHGDFANLNKALRVAQQTLKRAKIDAVSIWTNTTNKLEAHRAFRSDRSRQEGKRVGAVVIERVSIPAETSTEDRGQHVRPPALKPVGQKSPGKDHKPSENIADAGGNLRPVYPRLD